MVSMTASAPEPSALPKAPSSSRSSTASFTSRYQIIGKGAMSSMGHGNVPSFREKFICNRTADLTCSANDESALRHRASQMIAVASGLRREISCGLGLDRLANAGRDNTVRSDCIVRGSQGHRPEISLLQLPRPVLMHTSNVGINEMDTAVDELLVKMLIEGLRARKAGLHP
jgi:hypothetical protein